MRVSVAESPRVPAQGSSAQGKPAPKARAKAVADGNEVNIPQPAGMVTASVNCLFDLIGLSRAADGRPGKSPSVRPYPKPTQVDWLSIPRCVRERC